MSALRNAFLLGSLSCLLALPATQALGDTIFKYQNFSDTNGLTLVGNTTSAATSDGTVLRLTPANPYQSGAAYSTAPVKLGTSATFSTQFQFRFTDAGGIDPADGITFVLAATPTGLGANGGGLGYQGVAKTVAVEFDTYNNGPTDGNSSNHVAIDTGGNLNVLGLTNAYGISSCAFAGSSPHAAAGCLSNGDLWTANVSYNGSNLSVKLFDPAEGSAFTAIQYPINLGSILGTNAAFVGFTGSTGGGWENQDVVNWQLANTATLPASAPEPSTLLLFCAAGVPLFLIRNSWTSKAR